MVPSIPDRRAFVPLCEPVIRGNEWAYVKECLDTGWVSSVGSFVARFERELAARVGLRHAVATVNGTAALHTALLVAGVRPGDEVLTSTLTFIAPANAVRYVGAWPVFVDAEPDYWQMNPALVEEFLVRGCIERDGSVFNRATGRRVAAILPVHILGHPVDMESILRLARQHGIPVIEDATESLGAAYRGTPIGRLGDIGCFSFNGNKLITTGGGGMLVTDHEEWAIRARYLTTQGKDHPVEYIHGAVAYNYRLTNLQAAMGVAQLEQLDSYLEAKRRVARRYEQALGDLPGLTLMQEAPWACSAFWLYTMLVDEERCGLDARGLIAALSRQSIQGRPLWQPLHLSKPHAGAHRIGGEVSERLYDTAISLPCSVNLEPEVQDRVIDEVLNACTRGRPAARVVDRPENAGVRELL